MPFLSFFSAVLLCLFATTTFAGPITPREGWVIVETTKSYKQLITDVKSAAKAHGLGVVTQAGPTVAAAKRGITIPGNRVIGLFNNDFAVQVLATSTAAMIEAPVRVYVTENQNGTATLSYKTPSYVFAPYTDEGGAALLDLARQLDLRFEALAQQAAQ